MGMTTAKRLSLMAGRLYRYEPGSVRWLRVDDDYDPKSHRTEPGWQSRAIEMDHHPVTCNKLQSPQLWVRETYTGVLQGHTNRGK